MTIEQSFDDSSVEVLRATDLVARIPDFPETVICTYTRKVFNVLLANHAAVEVQRIYTSSVVVTVYVIEHAGKRFGLYMSLIGAAASAALMEELIAMGGRRFLFFGSCGVLDHAIDDAHIVVPTAAWRDEGVSYHYLPAADEIEIETAARLSAILTDLGVDHHTTKAWTTDAIYRETRSNVIRRREAGCGVVEMECAATAAVARLREVEFWQFVFAADSLAGDEWDPRSLATMPQDQRAALADLAVQIASRITP